MNSRGGVLEDVPWPRGHVLKSLVLASKVKSLASRPQVLENWSVLGSRTAPFSELLKFCGASEKIFGRRFFLEIAWNFFVKTFFFGDRLKNFCKDLFLFGEHLRLCPWSLASSISVLGLERVCPRKAVLGLGLGFFFFVSLALASSLVFSTPPLMNRNDGSNRWTSKCVLKAKDVLKDSTSVQYTQTVYRTEQKEWLHFEREPRLS